MSEREDAQRPAPSEGMEAEPSKNGTEGRVQRSASGSEEPDESGPSLREVPANGDDQKASPHASAV